MNIELNKNTRVTMQEHIARTTQTMEGKELDYELHQMMLAHGEDCQCNAFVGGYIAGIKAARNSQLSIVALLSKDVLRSYRAFKQFLNL